MVDVNDDSPVHLSPRVTPRTNVKEILPLLLLDCPTQLHSRTPLLVPTHHELLWSNKKIIIKTGYQHKIQNSIVVDLYSNEHFKVLTMN